MFWLNKSLCVGSMCECSPSFAQLLLQVNRNETFLNYWISLSQKDWSFTIFLLVVTAGLNFIILISMRYQNTHTTHTHTNFGRNYHAVSPIPLMQYSLNLWRRREYEKYFRLYALYTSVVWDLKAECNHRLPRVQFCLSKEVYRDTLSSHT